MRKIHTLIAWKNISYLYLRKPQEWKYYWWAACVGIFKIQNKKCSKKFSKEAACSKKTESSALEMKLRILGSKIRYRNDAEYVHCKEELDKLYEGKINGALIRSRCVWHEHGDKSSKYFLNLEKNRAVQNQIRTMQWERNNW